MTFGEDRPPARLIPLTPLIDVVFILLVFFMLASSYLDWRAVDLTVTSTGGPADAAQRALVIRLKADGTTAVGGESLTPEMLRSRVAAAVARDSEHRITILSEPEVRLQRAVDTLDAVKAAGASNVALARTR